MHSRRFRTVALALGVAAAAAAAAAQRLDAQSVRLHGTSTVQYAQLRPIQYDSTADSGAGAYRSLPVAYAAPFTQDLELSAWGLGITGLRVYGLFRARAALGSGLVWPRSSDHFDALYAYLELDRTRYVVRAGRQQRASGLGWYAFDGVAAAWLPIPAIRIEGYGGRGLARASLDAPNSSPITSLDPLRPDHGSILLGASLRAAPSARSTVTAIYQRELLSDRSGLISERTAFDGRLALGPRLILSGSADADVARQQWGKASVSANVLVSRAWSVALEAFQYRPALDLTTIWGVFMPESHYGYTATATVAASATVALSGSFTYRRWQPLSSGSPFLVDVGDDQKELGLGAHLKRGVFALDGSYHLQTGFGGKQSGGDLGVEYAPDDGWHAGFRATAFQQVGMFRVSGSTVYGIGAEVRSPLGHGLACSADVTRYFQRRLTGQTSLDWNQTRASLTLEWTMGADADHAGGYR
jgi:hypothetical protein